MELLGIQDIGSAGYDGFRGFQRHGEESEVRYIKGGHGAALNERNWKAIASFIIDGEMLPPPPQIYLDGTRSAVDQALIEEPSKFAPLLWLLLVTILSYLGRRIWLLRLSEGKRTAILLVFFLDNLEDPYPGLNGPSRPSPPGSVSLRCCHQIDLFDRD
jgi:hypothetical protein